VCTLLFGELFFGVHSFRDYNVVSVLPSNGTVGCSINSSLFISLYKTITISPCHSFSTFSRFSFTQLDPVDPSRKFSFVFLVNDEEKYDIIECKPNIDAKVIVDILEELNGTDREDMSMLVRRMRKSPSFRTINFSTINCFTCPIQYIIYFVIAKKLGLILFCFLNNQAEHSRRSATTNVHKLNRLYLYISKMKEPKKIFEEVNVYTERRIQ
jgi:hypothetical protein